MRESTGLENINYDNYLASKAKSSRAARQELFQRKADRKNAHDSSGVGYHFGIDTVPVKAVSKEHFKQELQKRGLMMAHEIKNDLR